MGLRITFRATSDESILAYLWPGLVWVGVGMVEEMEGKEKVDEKLEKEKEKERGHSLP